VEPQPDDNHLTIDSGPSAAELTQTIVERLGLDRSGNRP